MNTSKRIMLCLTAGFVLSGLAWTPDGGSEKPEQSSRVSATPVKIWLTDLKVKGERWAGSSFLREEKFGEFECWLVNRNCKDQQTRKNEVVRWNQTREELLRLGDTNRARTHVEMTLPAFQPCALEIDRAVTNWMLNPSVKIYRIAGSEKGKRIRGAGWTVEELGGRSSLWLDAAGAALTLLEGSPLILHGTLDKTVTDKLGNGEYELEVSLDTRAAANLNVADTGTEACRFFFRIKAPETDSEKWWLEQKKFREAGGKGEWKTVLSLADDALKRYQSQVIVYWLWCWKGNALQSMGKDEEALAAFEEAWKHRWKAMEPHDEWPVTEPMRELRRKLKVKADINSAQ